MTAASTATAGTYCWGQSIPTDGTGYDRYGNLLKINTSQCSAPALNVSVNAYNQITNSGYTYDATGDMLTDGSSNSYTWNGEGLLKSTGTVNYTYDGGGKRVEKSSGTYYWFDRAGVPLAETDSSGNTQNEYVYFGGNRTAWRDSGGNVYYYFRDQVGTTRMITNSSGTVCYDADYAPFGYEMAHTTNCSQNYKLAGMELDGETGNYHTLFRSYEPNLGRWMSPDQERGCIKDPQKLNLYPYVRNGPTYRTDRRGDQGEGPCDPFEDPLCFSSSGGCDPWNLLCFPPPPPILPYPPVLRSGSGGGVNPIPPDYLYCVCDFLIFGSTKGGGCTYLCACEDETDWVVYAKCSATDPEASEPCPSEATTLCPKGGGKCTTPPGFCANPN